jgi:hypothetical protein
MTVKRGYLKRSANHPPVHLFTPPTPAVLRRRFDSLKWDVKKCEDIVFDLQVNKSMDAIAQQQQRAMFTHNVTASTPSSAQQRALGCM